MSYTALGYPPCPEGEIFDETFDFCVPIQCAEGYELLGETCVPVIEVPEQVITAGPSRPARAPQPAPAPSAAAARPGAMPVWGWGLVLLGGAALAYYLKR